MNYLKKYENQKHIVSGVKEKTESNYSVTVAAGIKFNYSRQNGFSINVLNLEELSQTKKEYSLPIIGKGSRLNIYC